MINHSLKAFVILVFLFAVFIAGMGLEKGIHNRKTIQNIDTGIGDFKSEDNFVAVTKDDVTGIKLFEAKFDGMQNATVISDVEYKVLTDIMKRTFPH